MPTALWTAVNRQDTQRVIDLIAQQVDLNAIEGDQNETPLALAASYGPLEIVKLLLEAGAEPSIRDRDNGRNALHSHLLFFEPPAYIESLEYVRLLCSAVNLDINARDRGGQTALFYATALSGVRGLTMITNFLLLQRYCNVDNVDRTGDTPLYSAIRMLDFETAECLITHGADLNLFVKDHFHWATLLHHCIVLTNHNGIRFLLRQGADETLPDWNGRTPLEFAIHSHKMNIARIISEELNTRKLRVLAFMSGTHPRLGELSWIRALDAELVIDFIVRRYLLW